MKWLAYYPDLNGIENMWNIIKPKMCEVEKRVSNKKKLWEGLSKAVETISSE